MKKFLLIIGCLLLTTFSFAQTINQKLQKAFQQFENDAQLKHAISSLYVIDAKTVKVVFDKNSQVGLAPASTQKIITSITAFELLGKDYRYKTRFFSGMGGEMGPGVYMLASGDPTFGSWRYKTTTDTSVFSAVISNAGKKGWQTLGKLVIINNELSKNIPSGWIYEDIGNYYGAAPKNLNWHENQFDIVLLPGQEGEEAVIDTSSTIWWRNFINNCKTGRKGSGDNAYIFPLPGQRKFVIEGTIPTGGKKFTIAAADSYPDFSCSDAFLNFALSKGFFKGNVDVMDEVPAGSTLYRMNDTLYTHYSPPLDSIIYWLNKKSINLYAEALIKTFAYEKKGFGSTDSGVAIVKEFWRKKSIDQDELNISDGSGLSPQNRVTTHAQVEILKFAKTRDWFPYFYNSLPDYNGMTMKSGTIKDVKGFCGYHKAKDGKEYIFSFLVNNYNGPSSGLVNKMYKVLDVLK